MPSIKIIDRRVPSPNRRMPLNVNMTEVYPAPHVCRKVRKACRTYADGTIWCEHCMKTHGDHEVVDRRRGRPIQQIAPAWKPVSTD
jgi:hypothetical protein